MAKAVAKKSPVKTVVPKRRIKDTSRVNTTLSEKLRKAKEFDLAVEAEVMSRLANLQHEPKAKEKFESQSIDSARFEGCITNGLTSLESTLDDIINIARDISYVRGRIQPGINSKDEAIEYDDSIKDTVTVKTKLYTCTEKACKAKAMLFEELDMLSELI